MEEFDSPIATETLTEINKIPRLEAEVGAILIVGVNLIRAIEAQTAAINDLRNTVKDSLGEIDRSFAHLPFVK